MDSTKYIGMDVHKESISIAVLNSAGKLVMESVIETKAITILQFIDGLRGDLHVTFEEGTWAAWLYDLLKPHVNEVLVCDPRKNALLKEGNKNDRSMRASWPNCCASNHVNSVYHGEHGVRTLKELARSYLTISKDLVRVMTRVKAIYRSWAIPCRRQAGLCSRAIVPSGWARSRKPGCAAGRSFTTSNSMRCGRCGSKCGASCSPRAQKHEAWKLLCQIPSIGPIRAALLIAFCRRRTASAPSGSCGPTADLGSRRTAAPIIVSCRGSCSARRDRSRFAG